MSAAQCDTVPHIAVTDSRHCDHCPPKCVRYRLEERFLCSCFGEINYTGKKHNTCNRTKADKGRFGPDPCRLHGDRSLLYQYNYLHLLMLLKRT